MMVYVVRLCISPAQYAEGLIRGVALSMDGAKAMVQECWSHGGFSGTPQWHDWGYGHYPATIDGNGLFWYIEDYEALP